MPRPRVFAPAMVRHKSGQARVRLNGKDFYLGVFGTPQAEQQYRRLIAEHLTGTTPQPTPIRNAADPGISVAELILAYVAFFETYYIKDGSPTSELASIRDVMGMLREHYGMTPAKDFGPLRLKALREVMVRNGW